MSTKSYAKFISEQSKMKKIILGEEEKLDEIVSGYSPYSTKEDPKITDKVIKKTGDSDISHVGGTKEGHHVYAHSETDRGESSTYVVHHPDGKMTSHHVDHGGEPTSARELSKPANFHNVNKLPSSVRSIIHQDLKDNVDDHWN